MAGHERYLKTTIYGLTTIHPDYALVLVGANMGVSHMTKEHMSLCLTLKIPFIIVVSKIDLVPPHILEENLAKINEICRKGARKTPYSIRSKQDVINCAANIKSDSIIPIIQISNVTSFNLDLLKVRNAPSVCQPWSLPLARPLPRSQRLIIPFPLPPPADAPQRAAAAQRLLAECARARGAARRQHLQRHGAPDHCVGHAAPRGHQRRRLALPRAVLRRLVQDHQGQEHPQQVQRRQVRKGERPSGQETGGGGGGG